MRKALTNTVKGQDHGHQQQLPPPPAAEKVADQKGHQDHGDKVAQARAGIHHLELAHPQIDDIAGQHHAGPEKTHHLHRQVAGRQLELKGEHLVDKGRQGHDEHQNEQRETADAAP